MADRRQPLSAATLLLRLDYHDRRPIIQVAATGPVTIRVNGMIDAGGGSFANLTARPANLRIESAYTGNGGVTLGGGNNSFLTLYAPGTDVTCRQERSLARSLERRSRCRAARRCTTITPTTRAGWTIWKQLGSYYNLPGLPFVTP